MPQIDVTFLLLLALAGFCYATHNNTVTFAVLLLLVFRLTPLSRFLPQLQVYGVTVGIVILTAAILVPFVNGTLKIGDLAKSFMDWHSFLAILIGIFVSWLGMRGVSLIEASPLIVNGLIVGTLIGVAFFRGIPVGPLIAGGILSLFLSRV